MTEAKNIVLPAIFVAIISIFSQVVIPIGAIPINLALVGVVVCGSVLGLKRGLLAVFSYILIGCIGVPVFAGFKGGFNVLLGPTGGYIIGYLFVAAFSQKKLLTFVGLIICYITGTLWYKFVTGISFYTAIMTGVAPFVAFDIVKIIISLFISDKIKATLRGI